ncbi:MAG: GntR family transcriptional regulator [Planctomycetes bacterium]|nr:GntR family transcriptional regulator [Planctomycetota bacterium]
MSMSIRAGQASATRAPATKHERVRESLRRMIHDGTFAPGSQLPPEKDLPKRLRASKITVVRALNDLAREGLIVRRRGSGSYVADPTQRPLMPGRFLRLGLLLPFSVFPDFRYGPQQSEIIRSALQAWGLAHVIPEFPRVSDDEATRGRWVGESRGCCIEMLGEEISVRLKHPPLAAIREGRFDGLLSISVVEEAWTAELLNLGIPTVLVDYPNERFTFQADQVFFDPFPGYRAAVRAFAERGLRRIHFVGAWIHAPYARFADAAKDKDFFSLEKARPDPDSFMRQSAWRQAMSELGLRAPDEWSQFGWHDETHLRPLAERLASLPGDERPEAVICHGVHQAEFIAKVFAERGLPLLAAGAAGAPYHGRAWGIYANSGQLGSTAAALLLWKLQQPQRPSLRVGVPMSLNAGATEGVVSMSKESAHA